VRVLARAGIIAPQRGPRGEYQFTFQDIVLLRTASSLRRARVPHTRMRQAFDCLKRQLPPHAPLSAFQVEALGEHIVVSDGERAWDVETDQLQIAFGSEIAEVRPISPEVDDRVEADRWYQRGVDAEADSPVEARIAYRNAVQLDPTHADAQVNLGRLLHRDGKPAEAAERYRLALLHARHATAAFNLGIALEDMGHRAEARDAYRAALAIDPAMADAHYNLARLLEVAGDRLAAIRHLKACRRLDE